MIASRGPGRIAIPVLAAFWAATSVAGAAEPDWHDALPAAPDPGSETEAWQILTERVQGYQVDGAVILAARDLCDDVHGASAAGETLVLEASMVEKVLRGRGVTDTGFRPFVSSGSHAELVLDAFRAHVEGSPALWEGRTVGIGVTTIDGQWLLAAIAVERWLELAPFPRRLEVPGEVVLEGVAVEPAGLIGVLVSSPSGEVSEITVVQDGASFSCTIPFQAGDGIYMVEVLGRSDWDPKVLNLFPVVVGHGQVASSVLSVPWREGPSRNAWMLFDLINAERVDRDLGTLLPDHLLALVAMNHCRDMRDNGFFGHVSPTHGGLEERVEEMAGVLSEVAEVIALAKTPQAAFGNLLSSPAHAANIRDADMTHMGVAKVKTPDGMLFTVVFARR